MVMACSESNAASGSGQRTHANGKGNGVCLDMRGCMGVCLHACIHAQPRMSIANKRQHTNNKASTHSLIMQVRPRHQPFCNAIDIVSAGVWDSVRVTKFKMNA